MQTILLPRFLRWDCVILSALPFSRMAVLLSAMWGGIAGKKLIVSPFLAGPTIMAGHVMKAVQTGVLSNQLLVISLSAKRCLLKGQVQSLLLVLPMTTRLVRVSSVGRSTIRVFFRLPIGGRISLEIIPITGLTIGHSMHPATLLANRSDLPR